MTLSHKHIDILLKGLEKQLKVMGELSGGEFREQLTTEFHDEYKQTKNLHSDLCKFWGELETYNRDGREFFIKIEKTVSKSKTKYKFIESGKLVNKIKCIHDVVDSDIEDDLWDVQEVDSGKILRAYEYELEQVDEN